MIYFDKKIWETKMITNNSKSAWRCYKCEKGSLVLEEKIAKSRFLSIRLKCSSCERVYLVTGNVIPLENNREVDFSYYKINNFGLKPTHIRPTLSLFKIPDSISPQVKEKLMFSFDHFWHDLDACANKIRQAIELITLNFGGSGKTLHDKIVSLNLGAETNDALLALKWIGNDGSHASIDFKREDILNVYGILVETLNTLYPDKSEKEELSKIISVINQNKGIKSI